jgi:hypothetical protein
MTSVRFVPKTRVANPNDSAVVEIPLLDAPWHFVGKLAERRVAAKLRGLGYQVDLMPHSHPFDLMVNGKRVEVKYSRPQKSKNGRWRVSCASHRRRNESSVDVYVILLEDFPGYTPIDPLYLVFRSPINRPSPNFSWMTVRRNHQDAINNWSLLGTPNFPNVTLTGRQGDNHLSAAS